MTHRSLALLLALLLVGLLPGAALAAPPVAGDDVLTVDEDADATLVDVLADDDDADADPLAITGATNPAHGTVVVAPDGLTLTYEPDANYHGPDAFDYTVTAGGESDTGSVDVTVDPVNDAPVARDDPSPFGAPDGDGCDGNVHTGWAFMVPEDSPQTGTFDQCSPVGNDLDVDGDALTWEVVTGPQHGTIERLTDEGAENWLLYTPDPDYGTLPGDLPGAAYTSETGTFASDTFTYRAFDGSAYSEPATWTFWVVELNDDPTFTPGGTVAVDEDSGPYSQGWATNVSPGPALEAWQTVTFEVTGVVITGPSNLFLVAPSIAANGTLSFTPRANLSGSASVTVRLKDDGGTENYGMGFLTQAQRADDTSDSVTFTITVGAENDPPTADDDSITVLEDAAATSVPVLTGDADIDGDALDITSVTQGAKGSVVITGGGTGLTYDPTTNLNGADSFTYTISDGNGQSDTATVSVTITPQNDAPTADDDEITVLEDGAATSVPVLTGDADIDGDALDITSVTQGAKGAVVITGGGAGLTYKPGANKSGADSFTYTISDGNGASDTATVSVTITAQNDAPVADDDSITVLEDGAATNVPVLTGDTDVEGDDLDIISVTQGAKGAVVITGGGAGLTYKPGANKSGADSFTYTVSDGNGGSDTATVSVTITPVQDDTPNAVNDSATVPTGPAVAIPVLANDTDLDGDPLTIISKTNGAHGTVTITGGGSGLTYDPAPLYAGSDQFTYTVFDGFVTDTATVLVTVTPDTTAPTLSGVSHSMPAQVLSGSSVRVKFQWGASDPGSGIANYHLQLSVNGGAFATVPLPTATATSYERTLNANTTYQFRVRAKDKSGNISAYSVFPSLNPAVLQEGTSLATYTGSWSTSTNASMSGGKGRFTSSSTRRVAFTFTGKGVGWVTTRTTSSGRAGVYLDGALITTIDLDATSIGYRRMVYRASFATSGRHTLEIRPLGDGRVDIDAFVILR